MQPASELSGEESYLGEGAGATVRLTEEVMAQIDAEGPISFRKFFELALYHPEHGYYARPSRVRTGQKGDFFTAVSVGPLFGKILAEYALASWEQQGQPESFRIVEWGAEQGDLARDILKGAEERGGEFARALRYAVVEPLARKRESLQKRLPEIELVAAAGDLSPEAGLVIANELVDALPFWLVRWQEAQWWEKRVCLAAGGAGDDVERSPFFFQLSQPDVDLQERLSLLPRNLSEGYETELRPSLAPLLAEMSAVLLSGEILLFDYGFERSDLYHPSRTTGTLRTYGQHQAGEDPLSKLGQLDVTAHVDFTALEEDARAVGLSPRRLESQGRFLTQAAAHLLTELDGQVDPSFIRQFQTLTHPGHLGSKFLVFRARVDPGGVSVRTPAVVQSSKSD